jgi:hypothetical protein
MHASGHFAVYDYEVLVPIEMLLCYGKIRRTCHDGGGCRKNYFPKNVFEVNY